MFKRLATRDTLHGSRPNLGHRDPNGRIVPTPFDVSDKGASTKRCAGKKNDNLTYTYIVDRRSRYIDMFSSIGLQRRAKARKLAVRAPTAAPGWRGGAAGGATGGRIIEHFRFISHQNWSQMRH